VSCSNRTPASQQFLSFLLRRRQPPPRSRTSKEEERRPRARRPPRLIRRRHRTPRLHRTWRPHRTRHLPRRTPPRRMSPHHGPRRTPPRRMSPHHGPRRTPPRPTCRRSAQRRNRLAPRSGDLPGRPVHPLRRWRDTRPHREAPRLTRSNGRKPPAAMSAAGVERDSPNRPNRARATIRRASAGRAVQRPWALQRRALRQQHSPLTADATRPSNQMRPSPMG